MVHRLAVLTVVQSVVLLAVMLVALMAAVKDGWMVDLMVVSMVASTAD